MGSLSSEVTVALVISGLAVLGTLVTAVATLFSARANTTTDMAKKLLDSLQQQAAGLQAQVNELWIARRADAVLIRKMGDFIDVLERWILDEKGPPPPPRPEGT